jgi:glutamate racemase
MRLSSGLQIMVVAFNTVVVLEGCYHRRRCVQAVPGDWLGVIILRVRPIVYIHHGREQYVLGTSSTITKLLQ